MSDDILVSYVIPSYRGEDLLPRCLDSVLSQRGGVRREVIVVDDASDDGTVPLLRRDYPQVKVLVNRRNRGPAEAKNVGARQARGDFLAFLDNDVEVHPDWEEAMLDRFRREDSTLGACASRLLFVDPPGRINSAGGMVNLLGHAWDRGYLEDDSSFPHHPVEVIYACSAAMMVRGDVFRLTGGFDERLRYPFEDTDLGWRMNLYGYRILYEPRAKARHRWNTTMGGRSTYNKYLYERNRMRSVLKNMEGATLRWLAPEYLYLFLYQVREEGRDAPSRRGKWISWLLMARVVAWNLAHLPDTLRRRREIASRRKVSDGRLVHLGLLQPQVGNPPNHRSPAGKAGRLREGKGVSYPRRMIVGRKGEEALGEGWYEREEDGRGVAFRWTQERARVFLSPKGGEKELRIRTLMGHPREKTRAVVRLNGDHATEIEVPNRGCLHRLPLPAGRDPGVWEVEIQVLNPFRPREVLGVEDLRKLGMAVVSMGLY
ncbi:MAG: glycosyltransferase family 2 protein [Actinobacteria bacterium]|nr:glycosyltransferase family 2 protein [Actinomycetota bacterium]